MGLGRAFKNSFRTLLYGVDMPIKIASKKKCQIEDGRIVDVVEEGVERGSNYIVIEVDGQRQKMLVSQNYREQKCSLYNVPRIGKNR